MRCLRAHEQTTNAPPVYCSQNEGGTLFNFQFTRTGGGGAVVSLQFPGNIGTFGVVLYKQ